MTVNHGIAERINMNPEDVEHGLAQLVLTILELLRQLVERQAIKRVEGGTLTDEQIEILGTALLNLEEKMEELKSVFGLEGKDLNIDLGPLGNLM
ncbi:gas vesicle protein K [Bacillus sp. AFS077874]|uniref:gas vesicle protein K n=1 Tax=unclassified Bacillus (in: firmicutes) TaxID=185979 RepID=UPI000BED3630|nr:MULTISPECIES: gas vesicle protein K [unclassified Bacillus (in: firmicutes)]PEC50066.1 gas vesicle protein K [Bacillus sp. AFS096315]PFM79261.1 gas vesicle protein K [Bacillus sp. AFS077874]